MVVSLALMGIFHRTPMLNIHKLLATEFTHSDIYVKKTKDVGLGLYYNLQSNIHVWMLEMRL